MSATTRSERVLLVDDDPDIRQFIETAVLRAAGFHDIATAEGGEEGLTLALELTPDLIVTDVVHREVDGFEMVRRIRQEHGLMAPCIVFCTARSEPGKREEGLAAGADDYVTKPFDPPSFQAIIEAALDRTAERRRDLPSSP